MGIILKLYKWTIDRPSYMFMTACDERLRAQEPGRFTYVGIGLMGLAVLSGLMLIGAWNVVWDLFQDYDRLSRPAGVTAILMLVWPMRRMLVSIGPALRFRDRATHVGVATACAALIGVGLMSLTEKYWYTEYALPGWIGWIRPELSIFRVLLLMPVWGAWSMLITAQFRRPNGITDPITRRFAQGCGPLEAAGFMAPPMAGTIIFFHYMVWPGQIVVTCGTLVAAIGSGPVFCVLGGGMTRRALLAGNMVTQVVFLMLCTIWL